MGKTTSRKRLALSRKTCRRSSRKRTPAKTSRSIIILTSQKESTTTRSKGARSTESRRKRACRRSGHSSVGQKKTPNLQKCFGQLGTHGHFSSRKKRSKSRMNSMILKWPGSRKLGPTSTGREPRSMTRRFMGKKSSTRATSGTPLSSSKSTRGLALSPKRSSSRSSNLMAPSIRMSQKQLQAR